MPDSMGLDDSVPIKTLLITVFESVVEVFLLCLAGYILSKAGVTDKATQRKLNVINVSLFTPALLFSKVAYSLTPAKLKEMWIIPLGFVVVTGLSAGVAWVLAKLFKLKKSQTAYAMCAAMFQNSNSLPIALIQSLVIEVPGLKWGKDDTKDQMLGRALTYLVLYSTLGMMLRWSWGVKLLSQADDEAIEVEAEPNHRPIVHDHTVQSPEALAPHPGARETDPFFTSADNIAHDEQDERRNPSGQFIISSPSAIDEEPDSPTVPFTAPGSAHSMHPPLVKRGSTAGHSIMSRRSSTLSQHRKKLTRTESGREFWGLPEQPKVHHIALIKEDSSESEHEDEEWGTLTPSLRRRPLEPPRSPFQSFLFKVKNRTKTSLKAINDFMTVPMYAALLSIFIAMIPPLQAQMTRLKPLEQAIKGAGQCSIPVTLVVLGAFFYTPPDVKPGSGTIQLSNSHEEYNKKPNGLLGYLKSLFGGSNGSSSINDKSRAYPGENKTVFVAVISRMIIVPLLMLPVLALIAKYDPFEAAEDPVFILSAILLVSSPPALTLAQITQAASGDAFERLISKTISWSYAVLTPP
nr:endoplasmic reticulum protein [Kwoniella bestiolae CBS 10118]OCF26455.1 endoplasmic reticulum protein [Kwoniella bestiolae CBS 10118]